MKETINGQGSPSWRDSYAESVSTSWLFHILLIIHFLISMLFSHSYLKQHRHVGLRKHTWDIGSGICGISETKIYWTNTKYNWFNMSSARVVDFKCGLTLDQTQLVHPTNHLLLKNFILGNVWSMTWISNCIHIKLLLWGLINHTCLMITTVQLNMCWT